MTGITNLSPTSVSVAYGEKTVFPLLFLPFFLDFGIFTPKKLLVIVGVGGREMALRDSDGHWFVFFFFARELAVSSRPLMAGKSFFLPPMTR